MICLTAYRPQVGIKSSAEDDSMKTKINSYYLWQQFVYNQLNKGKKQLPTFQCATPFWLNNKNKIFLQLMNKKMFFSLKYTT